MVLVNGNKNKIQIKSRQSFSKLLFVITFNMMLIMKKRCCDDVTTNHIN